MNKKVISALMKTVMCLVFLSIILALCSCGDDSYVKESTTYVGIVIRETTSKVETSIIKTLYIAVPEYEDLEPATEKEISSFIKENYSEEKANLISGVVSLLLEDEATEEDKDKLISDLDSLLENIEFNGVVYTGKEAYEKISKMNKSTKLKLIKAFIKDNIILEETELITTKATSSSNESSTQTMKEDNSIKDNIILEETELITTKATSSSNESSTQTMKEDNSIKETTNENLRN